MSFYAEVMQSYNGYIDQETGLKKEERETLDKFIRDIKKGVLFASKNGYTHTEVRYDNTIRESLNLADFTLYHIAVCNLLSGFLYDQDKYAKAWELVITALGPEFDINTRHIQPSSYVDKYAVRIDWKASSEVTHD